MRWMLALERWCDGEHEGPGFESWARTGLVFGVAFGLPVVVNLIAMWW